MVRIIPYSAVKSTCKSFLGHVFDGKVSQIFKYAAEELLSALIATDLPLINNMAKSILSRQGDYFSAMQLKNMQERISAWLANYDFISMTRNFLWKNASKILGDSVIAIDFSDISKEFGGNGMEGMARGYDGSRKTVAMGHDIVSVAIVAAKRAIPLAVELIKGRKGKESKAKEIIKYITSLIHGIKPLFVFDRGFDSENFVNWILDESIDAAIRIKELSRDVFGTKLDIDKIMEREQNPTNTTLYSARRKVGATIKHKIGYWAKGGGKGNEQCLYRPVLIVSSFFNGSTIYLICTSQNDITNMDSTSLSRMACKAAQAYFSRWDIEVFFQDVKSMFGLEKARVRTFKRLGNMVALSVLAYEYVRISLMESPESMRKFNKLFRDNFGTIIDKFRPFVTTLRELLKLDRARCITGRPRKYTSSLWQYNANLFNWSSENVGCRENPG